MKKNTKQGLIEINGVKKQIRKMLKCNIIMINNGGLPLEWRSKQARYVSLFKVHCSRNHQTLVTARQSKLIEANYVT